MENIVRVSLWFGTLRQPSHDSMGSVGGARHSGYSGRTLRCPFGWAEHTKFRKSVHDWQQGKGCQIIGLYTVMNVCCQGLPYKPVLHLHVCP